MVAADPSPTEQGMPGTPALGRVLGSLGWQSIATVVSLASFSLISLIVARSVTPREFAVWGIVAILFNARSVLRLGLGSSLIYTHFDEERELAAAAGGAAVTSLAASAAIATVLFVSAPLIADSFDLDRNMLIWGLRVMAIGLVFLALEDIPLSLIERFMLFRRRAAIDMATTAGYVALSLSLLGCGYGIWSLIVGRMALGVVRTAVFWIACPVRPSLGRSSLARLPAMLGFGLVMNATALVSFAHENADNVLVGVLGGATALGAYALAYTIVALVPQFFGETLMRVFFSALATSRQDPATSEQTTRLLILLTAALTFPAVALLLTIAPALTVDVFGHEWAPAGAFLRVLALYGLARTCGLVIGVALSARGRPGIALQGHLLALVVSLVLAWPLSRAGAIGVAWAFALGQCAFAARMIVPSRHLFQKDVLITLARLAAVAATAAALSLGLDWAFNAAIALQLLAFSFAYVALCLALERRRFGLIGSRFSLASADPAIEADSTWVA